MSDGRVQMLRLSPAQEEQLLQLRKKHLRNLRNLYEDRQRLNLGVSQLDDLQWQYSTGFAWFCCPAY